MDSLTDAQLARLSQRGDREAFGFLARRWDGHLLRFLRRLLGNEEDARDACQETLLKAYMNIYRLKEPANFKAWIHQIALNLCRDRGRSAKGRKWERLDAASPGEAKAAEPVADQPGPLKEVERADLDAVLDEVLSRLPLKQRTAILLREIQGFTTEEIARLSDVPATTVRSRIFYGLKTLRQLLPEYGITKAHLGEGGTKR